MEIKKFNEYIKEDTASGYDIEHPFTGDGDDLSTQEIEGSVAVDSDNEAEMEIIYVLSNLEEGLLHAIATGKIDIKGIAKTLLSQGEIIKGLHDEE